MNIITSVHFVSSREITQPEMEMFYKAYRATIYPFVDNTFAPGEELPLRYIASMSKNAIPQTVMDALVNFEHTIRGLFV